VKVKIINENNKYFRVFDFKFIPISCRFFYFLDEPATTNSSAGNSTAAVSSLLPQKEVFLQDIDQDLNFTIVLVDGHT